MTTVNVSSVSNTVVVTENGSSTVVTVPVTSTVTATTAGPQGPKGDAGAAYEYQQVLADTTWTINHNLGYKPGVSVYNTGSQEIEAEVIHTSVNQTLIVLTLATAGFARLT